MTNINDLILCEFIDHPFGKAGASAAKQAAVWGIGGGLSYLASKEGSKSDKKTSLDKSKKIMMARRILNKPKPQLTPKEKEDRKKHLKVLSKSIGAGALAEAVGSIV